MECNNCNWKDIVNDNGLFICRWCARLITYYYWENYENKLQNIKKIFYSRLTYLIYLINNINHRYIIYDDDLFNMYEKLKDFLIFDYATNKRYIKKNKIACWYHNIYYFMYLKYKGEYLYINRNIKEEIIKLFIRYENIYNQNRKWIKLKKKFLNYHYILYKIFLL